MSCSDCEPRAEDCFELDGPNDGDPCTCPCHDSEAWHRTSGEWICSECGKTYYKHPRGGPIGMGGKRFLRRLCDGKLVKL